MKNIIDTLRQLLSNGKSEATTHNFFAKNSHMLTGLAISLDTLVGKGIIPISYLSSSVERISKLTKDFDKFTTLVKLFYSSNW